MSPELYTRPNKPMRTALRPRRKAPALAPLSAFAPLIVDKATECFVTPPAIGARMVAYLGGVSAGQTLEPSAGTGALIQALLAKGYEPRRITAVERHNRLAAHLDDRVAHIVNRCFLDYAQDLSAARCFDHIVMNPPFKNVRAHIRAALSLLTRGGGVMVALVPINYHHPEAEILEVLDRGTFIASQVQTKLIRFEK